MVMYNTPKNIDLVPPQPEGILDADESRSLRESFRDWSIPGNMDYRDMVDQGIVKRGRDRFYNEGDFSKEISYSNTEEASPSFFTPTTDSASNGSPSFFAPRQNILPEDIANSRAVRYNFAMGGDDLNEQNIKDEIRAGNEENYTATQALEDRTSLNLRRANLIKDYSKNLPPSELTSERLKQLQELDRKEVEEAYANPNTFFERKFAKKVQEVAFSPEEKTPEVTFAIRSYDNVLINKSVALKFFEDYKYDPETERTYGQAALDFIPFYRWYSLKDNYVDNTTGKSILLGQNIRGQIEAAYRLNPDKFYETQKKILDDLREKDPAYAQHYASALLGYTSSDEMFDNLISYFDLGVITPVSIVGLAQLGRASVVSSAKQTYRSSANLIQNLKLVHAHGRMKAIIKNMTPDGKVNYNALLPEARRSFETALNNIRSKAANTGQVPDLDELMSATQDIFNPNSILTGARNITAEQVAELEYGLLKTRTTALDEIISRPRNLPRLSEEEVSLAASRAEEAVSKKLGQTTWNDHIVRVASTNIDATNTLINTDAIATYFGTKNKTGFITQAGAKGLGTRLGIKKFTTEEIGGKWYVKTYTYLDEKDPTLHGFKTPNAKYDLKDRKSWIAPILSKVRMRENLVPEQLSEDILSSMSGTNAYFQANERQFLNDFSRLNSSSKKDLDTFMERERDYRVPANKPEDVTHGRYSKNVGEFQTNFSAEMGRQPTFEETKAYFSWKTWNDIDYATRNLDLTRDMARLGIESHTLLFRFPGSEDIQRTPELEGKIITDPNTVFNRTGDAGILIWDPSETWLMFNKDRYGRLDPGKGKFVNQSNPIRKGRMTHDERAYLESLMRDQGYVAVQLTPWAKDNLENTMRNWGGSAPDVPGPYKPPIPKNEKQKQFAQEAGRVREYTNRANNAPSIIDKVFYEKMSQERDFRLLVESGLMPKSRAAKANFLVDNFKGSNAPKDVRDLQQARKKLGRPFETKDFSKKEYEGVHGIHRLFLEKDLESAFKKGESTTNKVLSTSSDFEIATVDSDPQFITALTKNTHKGTAYNSAKEAKYYLISDPNKPLSEGINVVVLNEQSKSAKSKLQEVFTDTTFLTMNQAEEYFKSGKLPSSLSPTETLAKQSVPEPSKDFSPGDEVYIMTPADKKELEKKGFLEGIQGAPKYKVQNVLTDPNRPELGSAVQLEGSPTAIPVKDLYIVNKAPDVPSDKVKKYMEGLDLTGKQRYDYILVKPEQGLETKAMSFTRFPYREGGHKLIEDDWKVVEPRVYGHTFQKSKINTYEGDTNMYTGKTEKEVRAFNDHMNEIKRIMKDDYNNNTNNAEGYYNRYLDGTSKTWKDFRAQFKEVNGNGHLSFDTPNVVVPRDHSSWKYINDLRNADGTPYYSNLQNQRDSAHNLFHNDLNLKFALERSDNLESVVRKGTTQQPVFGTETGGNVSPMATLINSTSQLLRGRLLDDLKIKSAENFGKLFADVIDATPEEIFRDPMKFLINPQWKTDLKGQDAVKLLAAKDYRRAVTDFIGVKTPAQQWADNVQQQIAENISSKLGNKYEWVDQHLKRSNALTPLRWANNMVFDLYFGFANVKQLLTQAMSSFHTVAVLGPDKGLRAGFTSHLARWVLFNDNVDKINHVAKLVEKSGLMKADHFVEALNAYKNSGFHIVRQETSFQDDFINQSIKPGFIDRSRDAARFFFKEGDRFSRTTGWFGSYMEWRAANPTAKLTERKSYELLKRANDLTLNMTSASQAAIAKGIGNIPLKFTTYYLRVMEQLLPGWTGSRLTAKEKMRAYATYSIMFGAPITAAGTFGLWPFHKEVAKGLLENGYETDENLVLKAFNGGLAELLPHLVGVDQNFSEVLGPSGTTWMYDIYQGRSPIFDIVTGVGGTKLEDTFESAWPFFTFVANVFRKDDEKYPLSWSDMETFARSIASVNNTWRAIQMYNTGTYMSLNRTPLMRDVTTTDAAMSLIFGTQPTELQQAFVKLDMARTTREMKKDASKDIQKYHRLKMKAIVDDDVDAAIHYGKAIKWLIQANNFTHDELSRLSYDTVTRNYDLVTVAEKTFNNSTPERKKTYFDKTRKQSESETK